MICHVVLEETGSDVDILVNKTHQWFNRMNDILNERYFA
jgi:hypothetical protein